MTTTWHPGAKVVNLSGHRGNGPFGGSRPFLGVILHVNVDEHGTSDSFFENNPDEVTPNFQVYKSKADGGVHQYLPLNWQPWCQINGNFNYAAIETAGLPSEPLTDYQCEEIAKILRTYHDEMGMVLQVANSPGVRGLGTHQMGGVSWGGHVCPGVIRAHQRKHILRLAAGSPQPHRLGEPHLRHPWPSYMGPGDFFGNVSRGKHSRGGFNKVEQPDVLLIKSRLRELGFSGMKSDGVFRDGTEHAVAAWQHKNRPHSQFYGQVWSDDWHDLFTY